MRQLSLQEVTHISGAADTSIVDTTVQDSIKWITGALGAFEGYTASTTYALSAFTGEAAPITTAAKVGAYGLGGLCGAAGAVSGYLLGKLLTDYVVKPYA